MDNPQSPPHEWALSRVCLKTSTAPGIVERGDVKLPFDSGMNAGCCC